MFRILGKALLRIFSVLCLKALEVVGCALEGIGRGFWFGVGLALGILFALAVVGKHAHAETVPHQAARFKADLTRCARVHWGLEAPVATFAAQVHQESRWNPNAVSPVGAKGLTQFMPATSAWMGNVDPELAANQPFNPGWALRALSAYDKWLWDRVQAFTPCDRMAMTLSAYNGGLGWVQRDKTLAHRQGADPLEWFDSVERFNAGRSAAAFRENRGYPRRILLTLEPLYVQAGWGLGVCHDDLR